MKQSRKYLIVTIVALVLLGGILGLTIKAELDESSESDRYRTIVDTFDSSLKSLKLDQAPTGDFSNIKSNYDNIILSEYENRSFDQDQELIKLDNEIKNTLNNFSSTWQNYRFTLYYYRQRFGKDENYYRIKETMYEKSENVTTVSKVTSLRSDMSKMLNKIGIGMPIAYEHSTLIVFAMLFLLSFLVTMGCRKLIDWSALNEAKSEIEDWRNSLMESDQKRGKRKKNEDVEDKEIRDKQEMMWGESFKQGVMYLFPFLAVVVWLSIVYSGTSLAWIPFESLHKISWIGVSLDLMGWSILCYFTISYVLRYVLIPE